MEFNNLTTRTYTALTCKLIVSTKKTPASRSPRENQSPPVDFTLHLDHPERGESERITLQGQFQQLNRLQQVVSKYITELVAKFPFPNMNDHTTAESSRSTTTEQNQDLSTPELDTETSIGSKLYPSNDPQSTKSGIMNNLPGLRSSLNISNAASGMDARSNSAATSGISKLFGGWNKQNSSKKSKAKQQHTPLGAAAAVQSGLGKREVEDSSAAKSANHYALATPYLTGSERSLDRHLHLGDLANSASGDTITLSPIQLFDLSTVLDEYALEDSATNQPTEAVTFSRTNIPGNQDRFIDPATVSLGRLPNLPRTTTAVGSQTSQVYNRTRSSRSSRSSVSFMSVIPWAAAAAVAVGVPLMLLDSKPNPLKDASSKVRMPDMEGVKKTVTAVMSPPIIDPEITNTPTDPAANPNLPKPWAAQPVNPPQTSTTPVSPGTQLQSSPTVNTGIQPIQTNSKPGIAPLPPTLDGNPGQDLPLATEIPADNAGLGVLSVLPRDGSKSGIAPNPLSANQLPSIGSSGFRPLSKSGMKNTSPTTTANSVKTTELQRNRLSPAIKPGTVSVSTQPILLPSDLPGIGIDSSNSSGMPSSAQSPQKAKQKVKPIVTAKTSKQKTVKPIGASIVRQPLFDQSNLIPANPNFINPAQIPSVTEGNDVQSLPIVPTQPFPTSAAGNWPGDLIDSPSLQEARTYFQSKWKTSNTQANPLQYVVQINGKSGTVRSVSPQGEAATTYLKQTKLVKPGQKLVSPDVGGNDLKIRVVLQTDGNVDTFIEP